MRRRYRRHWRHRLQTHHVRPQRQRDSRKATASDRHILGPTAASTVKSHRSPRPHIGFGVSKAGAEAQALAEALSNYDDVDRASLTAYNSVRQPLSERIVAHGRKLGMQLGVGIQTNEDRAFAKLLQSPKGILDWIAVPNFLDAGT
jgi:2-polyprenyl-6-methoxyphenol hydroxylase-like FAD-dependent oxidoreductase